MPKKKKESVALIIHVEGGVVTLKDGTYAASIIVGSTKDTGFTSKDLAGKIVTQITELIGGNTP